MEGNNPRRSIFLTLMRSATYDQWQEDLTMKSINYPALIPNSSIYIWDAKTIKNTPPYIIDMAHTMPNTKTSSANPDKQDLGNLKVQSRDW